MKLQLILFALFATFAATIPLAHSGEYTKIGIVTAAKAAGRWEALKHWISEAGLSDEWDAASYIPDDHPGLGAATNAIIGAGVATAEEVAAILEAARDSSVSDALIGAMYSREMQSAEGRRRWHGKSTTYNDVTNWVYVTIYEDGYRHVEPRPGLSPAQKAAATTNKLTKGVSRRLAEARLRHLAEEAHTNIVTNVVTPDVEPTDLPSEALVEEDPPAEDFAAPTESDTVPVAEPEGGDDSN